jgi:hypothetical protein
MNHEINEKSKDKWDSKNDSPAVAVVSIGSVRHCDLSNDVCKEDSEGKSYSREDSKEFIHSLWADLAHEFRAEGVQRACHEALDESPKHDAPEVLYETQQTTKNQDVVRKQDPSPPSFGCERASQKGSNRHPKQHRSLQQRVIPIRHHFIPHP